MSSWRGWLTENPVLTKEMRVRMRGARAYWILFGYLGLLAILVILRYWGWQNNNSTGGMSKIQSAVLGKELFSWISIPQVFLVLFITPAITSATLTVEREQQTLDMLVLTRLRLGSIVFGKLLSAVLFTALLIISSLPLFSICFMLGGVSPSEVATLYLELLAVSILTGSLGLSISSRARSTSQAVLSAYFLLFLLSVFVLYSMGSSLILGNSTSGSVITIAQYTLWSIWFGNTLFGFHTLAGSGFILFCFFGAWLMSLMAAVSLELRPERKGYLLRAATMLTTGTQLLLADIWWVQAWYSRSANAILRVALPPTGSLVLIAIALLALVPIFASGNLAPGERSSFGRAMRSGWTLQGLREGSITSGALFLLLLTLACFAVYCAVMLGSGKSNDMFRAVSSGTKQSLLSPLTAMTALLSYVLGFSLFCLLLSALIRNREISLAISFALLALVLIVPGMIAGSDNPANILMNLRYLNPTQPFLPYLGLSEFPSGPPMLFGLTAFWKVCSLSWLLIGAGSLTATALLLKWENARRVKLQEP